MCFEAEKRSCMKATSEYPGHICYCYHNKVFNCIRNTATSQNIVCVCLKLDLFLIYSQ